MYLEGYQRSQVIEHCWSIYLLLSDHLPIPPDIHLAFPIAVEETILSGFFHIILKIREYSLHIREEYSFDNFKLLIANYSYNLIDTNGNNLLRADPLPYHNFDHKGDPLEDPPHHIHDERGNIHSFTGDLHDFIEKVIISFI